MSMWPSAWRVGEAFAATALAEAFASEELWGVGLVKTALHYALPIDDGLEMGPGKRPRSEMEHGGDDDDRAGARRGKVEQPRRVVRVEEQEDGEDQEERGGGGEPVPGRPVCPHVDSFKVLV